MKKLFTTSLFALFVVIFTFNPVYATDYTIKEIPDPASPILSYVIPLVPQTSTASSVTQQIYLASDLTDLEASEGSITGIKLYYGGKLSSGSPTAVTETVTRNLKIYLTTVNDDALTCYDIAGAYGTNYRFKFLNQGSSSLVHEGNVSTETTAAGEIKTLPITFNKGSFAWDGSSNLLLTIFDVTNTAYTSAGANLRFELMNTDGPRFVHQYWTASGANKAEDYLSTLTGLEGYSYTSSTGSTAKEKQINGHKYVAKITFCIDEITLPSVPTGLAASDASTNSITLSWSAASSATAYDLQYKDGETWKELASDIDETSYTWTGRDANTSYEVRVRATNTAGNSEWSDAVSVSTEPEFVYKEITFEKWSSTTSMPLSGNYYLANDVELGANVSLTADLNLCLNGHKINTYVYNIVVPDEKKLTIYDNEGDGQIYGYYVGNNASYYGLISVVGELVLSEGTIRNLSEPESGDVSYAIYNNGTFKLSGAPTITGNTADIHLWSNKYITIESGKPLTNTTPYSVNAVGQVITSGWSANMGDANPSTHFTSAKSGYSGLTISEGEVKLVQAISLSQNDSEETFNSKISGKTGIAVNVSLDRTFTSASYNTLCLPFALSDAQLQVVFGAGYDLEELTSTSIEEGNLYLTFTKRTALEAGKPYLLQPAANVSNPVFEGVTITATSPGSSVTASATFHGIYSPKELEGGNQSLLFLGAGNTLFYPSSTASMNGFRAYFELSAGVPKGLPARIVQHQNTATGVESVLPEIRATKRIENGQLYLIYEGTKYNVQGQMIK